MKKSFITPGPGLSLSTHLFVSFHQIGCSYYEEGNNSLRHNLASTGLFVVLCVWVQQPFDIGSAVAQW